MDTQRPAMPDAVSLFLRRAHCSVAGPQTAAWLALSLNRMSWGEAFITVSICGLGSVRTISI